MFKKKKTGDDDCLQLFPIRKEQMDKQAIKQWQEITELNYEDCWMESDNSLFGYPFNMKCIEFVDNRAQVSDKLKGVVILLEDRDPPVFRICVEVPELQIKKNIQIYRNKTPGNHHLLVVATRPVLGTVLLQTELTETSKEKVEYHKSSFVQNFSESLTFNIVGGDMERIMAASTLYAGVFTFHLEVARVTG